MMRSKLFVPAIRPELFAKAEASAADSLSFDLEDSVPEARKDEARDMLAEYLRTRSANPVATAKEIIVRINAASSAYFDQDVAAIVPTGPGIINLPMAEDPAEIVKLANAVSRHEKSRDIRILVNIETPLGLRRAASLAGAHERVMGLQIGYADLLEPCGMDRRDEGVLSYVRMAVRMAAAEAGVDAYDAAFAAVNDADGFRQECLAARRQGYAGKSCIHPSQIAIANECFLPSPAEIAWARKILGAAESAEKSGLGAFLVDGKMVDKPFIARARAIMALAEKVG
jgi:citrate lyase subunit beta/citryl-CoA lyase